MVIARTRLDIAERNHADATCCEAVNAERTLFIAFLAQLFSVPEALSFSDVSITLEILDKIKTAAFDAYAELLSTNSKCCAGAAVSITLVTEFFLLLLVQNILFLIDPVNACALEAFLKLYKKTLRLILFAAKSGKCCQGVFNGLNTFVQGGILIEAGITLADILEVLETLLKALATLLKKGHDGCCVAAGSALGSISVGYLKIISNLRQAAAAGYFGEGPNADLELANQIRQENALYRKLLIAVIKAAASKCSRCCAQVVAGIALLYSGLGGFYFELITSPGPRPVSADFLGLYQVYLGLLRKIRDLALSLFEVILNRATEKQCCYAVANGLAQSTLEFLLATVGLFNSLVLSLLADPPLMTLAQATALLTEFVKEYPPSLNKLLMALTPRNLPPHPPHPPHPPRPLHHPALLPPRPPLPRRPLLPLAPLRHPAPRTTRSVLTRNVVELRRH